MTHFIRIHSLPVLSLGSRDQFTSKENPAKHSDEGGKQTFTQIKQM